VAGSISPNLPSKGEPLGTSDSKIRGSLITLRDGLNAVLGSGNKVSREGLESDAKPVTWYTPKIINTEEARANTAFGTLPTADEVSGVVVPSNSLIVIGYQALIKQSVSKAARAAIFLGANQLKQTSGVTNQESLEFEGTEYKTLGTTQIGLAVGQGNVRVGTGQILGAASVEGFAGCTTLYAEAGTYNISVKFKATSGSVTAAFRGLWVYTLGV
jgi:hypothetical protein